MGEDFVAKLEEIIERTPPLTADALLNRLARSGVFRDAELPPNGNNEFATIAHRLASTNRLFRPTRLKHGQLLAAFMPFGEDLKAEHEKKRQKQKQTASEQKNAVGTEHEEPRLVGFHQDLLKSHHDVHSFHASGAQRTSAGISCRTSSRCGVRALSHSTCFVQVPDLHFEHADPLNPAASPKLKQVALPLARIDFVQVCRSRNWLLAMRGFLEQVTRSFVERERVQVILRGYAFTRLDDVVSRFLRLQPRFQLGAFLQDPRIASLVRRCWSMSHRARCRRLRRSASTVCRSSSWSTGCWSARHCAHSSRRVRISIARCTPTTRAVLNTRSARRSRRISCRQSVSARRPWRCRR